MGRSALARSAGRNLLCTEIAAAGGDDKLVSVAALGALVARAGWVTPDSVRSALREMAGKKRPEVIEADLGVFDAGMAAEAATASRPT
jgi:Pyruvate/2-oxoacid:ferredoxin oxidoreductase gamma subunit